MTPSELQQKIKSDKNREENDSQNQKGVFLITNVKDLMAIIDEFIQEIDKFNCDKPALDDDLEYNFQNFIKYLKYTHGE